MLQANPEWRPEQQTSITLDADNDDGDDGNDSHILTLLPRRRRRPHNDAKCLRHTQNIMSYCCMYVYIYSVIRYISSHKCLVAPIFRLKRENLLISTKHVYSG